MNDTYSLDRRPPCWPMGAPCPNSCAQDLHRRVVTNHVELTGPWAGWRLAGRDLVAPSGERIQNAGCVDCSGTPMPATSGIRSACGTQHAKRFSSRWSRSSWWILANGENATSDASRDKALSVGAVPLHPWSFAGVLDDVVPIAGQGKVTVYASGFIRSSPACLGALACRPVGRIRNRGAARVAP